MCVESTERRKAAFENLLSEKGVLLRMNGSVPVEGAFGVLKSDRNFRRFLMRGKTNISPDLHGECGCFQHFEEALFCNSPLCYLFSIQYRWVSVPSAESNCSSSNTPPLARMVLAEATL